jgi:hypothetical protein
VAKATRGEPGGGGVHRWLCGAPGRVSAYGGAWRGASAMERRPGRFASEHHGITGVCAPDRVRGYGDDDDELGLLQVQV